MPAKGGWKALAGVLLVVALFACGLGWVLALGLVGYGAAGSRRRWLRVRSGRKRTLEL